MRLPPWLEGLLRLMACALSIAFIGALAFFEVRDDAISSRGVESGLEGALPTLQQPRWGTQTALEQYPSEDAVRQALAHVKVLGMGAVRQRFAWAELEPEPGVYRWEVWDRILPIVRAEGLMVIAVLDTSPTWARPAWESDNRWAPPLKMQDYARFVGAFAARYGAHIQAYQVWDQPNIYPHWGRGAIAPSEYVEMLKEASKAIRQSDSDALIIAGGLAPNTESGGRNLSEPSFLREMYRRGAGGYFDILGVKTYGFWSGPYDRRVDENVLNFSRVILLREEMVRRGEASKPIWALEAGWNALPEDWRGEPSPTGSDNAFVQSERLRYAIERVQREWPWLGLMCLMELHPSSPITDPVWGYALLDSQGQPGFIYESLRALSALPPTIYPGRTLQGAALLTPTAAGIAELRYWGTDIAVELQTPPGGASLTILSDIAPRQRDVTWDTANPQWLQWKSTDDPNIHRLLFKGEIAQSQALQKVAVGARRSRNHLWSVSITAILACAWLAMQGWRAARAIPWKAAWAWCRQRWERLPPGAHWGAPCVTLAMMLWAPTSLWRASALALYGLTALLQPEIALWCAVATIPLAPLSVRLGSSSFAVTELAMLIATGAWIWSTLWQPSDEHCLRFRWGVTSWVDRAIIGLVILAAVASLAAEYRHVALRELRLTVVEPTLLYALLWMQFRRRKATLAPMALIDALWISAVGVALYTLLRYPFADGAIEAEGVRRARAFFGSPNNLALYLERMLPLGMAIAIWGRARWRRWLYAVGTAPVALALMLTFSRGAWFLGVPAALLVLAGVRRGWSRRIIMGMLLLAVFSWIGLSRVPRFASSFDLSQGTALLRVKVWQSSWNMLRDHLALGVGPDNFLYYYGDYLLPGAEVDRWLSHPHNVALDFALRLGLGGVALLMTLLGSFAWRAWKRMHFGAHTEIDAASLGIAAGMAAGMAHGLIDSAYFVIELAYWFMFALVWMNSPQLDTPKTPVYNASVN